MFTMPCDRPRKDEASQSNTRTPLGRTGGLRALPLFRDLSPSLFSELEAGATVRTFRTGDTLATEGSPVLDLKILLAGRVQMTRSRAGLWWQTIGEAGPGAPIELIPVLDQGPSPATVTALEDGAVIVIPGEVFSRLLQRDPTLATRILRCMAGRVRALVDLVGGLSLLTLEERLVDFLLKHAPRTGDLPGKAWSFTHEEVAQRIGGCREEVTRILCKLKKRGLLAIGRRRIEVLDAETLQRLAARVPATGIGV